MANNIFNIINNILYFFLEIFKVKKEISLIPWNLNSILKLEESQNVLLPKGFNNNIFNLLVKLNILDGKYYFFNNKVHFLVNKCFLIAFSISILLTISIWLVYKLKNYYSKEQFFDYVVKWSGGSFSYASFLLNLFFILWATLLISFLTSQLLIIILVQNLQCVVVFVLINIALLPLTISVTLLTVIGIISTKFGFNYKNTHFRSIVAEQLDFDVPYKIINSYLATAVYQISNFINNTLMYIFDPKRYNKRSQYLWGKHASFQNIDFSLVKKISPMEILLLILFILGFIIYFIFGLFFFHNPLPVTRVFKLVHRHTKSLNTHPLFVDSFRLADDSYKRAGEFVHGQTHSNNFPSNKHYSNWDLKERYEKAYAFKVRGSEVDWEKTLEKDITSDFNQAWADYCNIASHEVADTGENAELVKEMSEIFSDLT